MWGSLCFMVAAALITCVNCRRYGVLLWLGGILVVPAGLWASLADRGLQHLGGGQAHVMSLVTCFVAIPLLAAGTVLLVGGVVRLGLAEMSSWRGQAGGPPGPPGGAGPGSQTDG